MSNKSTFSGFIYNQASIKHRQVLLINIICSFDVYLRLYKPDLTNFEPLLIHGNTPIFAFQEQ